MVFPTMAVVFVAPKASCRRIDQFFGGRAAGETRGLPRSIRRHHCDRLGHDIRRESGSRADDGTPIIDDRHIETCEWKEVGNRFGEIQIVFHRVCVTRIARARLVAARRCRWRVGQPANIRKVWLSAAGALSAGEG